MGDLRDDIAKQFEEMAGQLELAAKHCQTAARHFQEKEVPRGCAHAFAANGLIATAQDLIQKIAKLHAAKATPD